MKLPLPFFQNKKEEESEYFLALLLTDEKASAVVLKQSLGKLKVLNKHEEFFPLSLEESNLEELISLVDRTISRAEEVLPPDIETHKTVFGVKDTWVEEETKKITKDNLSKLKKVCDALDLTPIGFMVVTEAISHLLQEEEGAPLSAILAEIGRKTVTLNLMRGGKSVERIDGPIEHSAPATVDNLLKHFTTAVLPARILIYDAKRAEELQQQFIGHQWSKSLPFLHVPQITALPAGFDAKSVAFGAAQQMGFELEGMNLKIEGKMTQETNESTEQDTEDSDYVPSKRLKRPIGDEEDEIQKPKITDEHEEEPFIPSRSSISSDTPLLSGNNFGFVTDADITKTTPLPSAHEPAHHAPHQDTDGVKPHFDNFEEVGKVTPEEMDEEEDEQQLRPNPLAFLSKLHLPKIAIPKMGGNRRFIIPLVALAALIIFISWLTSFYNNSVQAQVILSVKPKMVNQDASVTFSGNSSSDFSKNLIAAKPIDTSVDGSVTTSTTGKKDVGNKAKGTVTVYNNDNNSITLENGTAIKSSNGIVFLLDKAVTVASASGDIFSGTKPGTADVPVTARDIGTEANLPSGTKFTIGSNASLGAKNDNAFSGGSKKTVQVVSSNDIAKLKSDLPKSLEDKAKSAIAQTAGSDETVLPFISVVSLQNAKFDNNVNDEATTVKLTASVKFESLAYKNDEVNSFAKSLLKEKYSQTINDSSIKNTVTDPKQDKDAIDAKLNIEAGLLPDIDTEDVANKLEKMSLKSAKTFLAGLPQVAESKVNFSPNIPLLPNLIPHLPKHVSIEVKPE